MTGAGPLFLFVVFFQNQSLDIVYLCDGDEVAHIVLLCFVIDGVQQTLSFSIVRTCWACGAFLKPRGGCKLTTQSASFRAFWIRKVIFFSGVIFFLKINLWNNLRLGRRSAFSEEKENESMQMPSGNEAEEAEEDNEPEGDKEKAGEGEKSLRLPAAPEADKKKAGEGEKNLCFPAAGSKIGKFLAQCASSLQEGIDRVQCGDPSAAEKLQETYQMLTGKFYGKEKGNCTRGPNRRGSRKKGPQRQRLMELRQERKKGRFSSKVYKIALFRSPRCWPRVG